MKLRKKVEMVRTVSRTGGGHARTAHRKRLLADTFGEDTMELTVSGVEDGTVLRDIAFTTAPADRHLSDLTFAFPGTPADSISGSFLMTAFTLTGDYREATTFDATFVRSGQHTYTQGV